MISRSRLLVYPALLLAFLGLSTPAKALETVDIQKIIKDYIMEHPEVIVDALEAYQRDEQARAEATAVSALEEHYAVLTASDQPSVGNPDASVTVIEFFDYNCGYCKKAFPDVQELVAKDSDVRVVFQEFPVLGQSSEEAARWSLAAQKQGKYFEYHAALMDYRGQKNKAALLSLARDVGLDTEQLETDANSPEIAAAIERSRTIARDLNINGTPAFIVQKEFYRGYLGEGGLEHAVNDARGQ